MGGASLPVIGGDIGKGFELSTILNPAAWAGAGYNAVARSVNDPVGAKNAASNALTQQRQLQANQASQARDLQQQLLTQPKNITPDNFLAMKSRQLANLRLGLASTITQGPGGLPSPVLSAPSLTGNNPGKSKFGQ